MKSSKPLVLIMCGGRSLRLWPLSEYKSKNFLDIFGFSPLELTVKRFLKITPKENIFLVASHQEKKSLQKVKLIKKENIFYEPDSKNTAAAIIYSLQFLKKHSKKVLIISPVDHLIKKEKEFYKALKKALAVSKQGCICTLGIKPLEPTPNFGYIQTKNAKPKGVFAVKRFIEKPKLSFAKKLIAKGNCFYNSGMFISTVGTLLQEYKTHYHSYKSFVKGFDSRKIASLYKRIIDIPFDKAIMEKSKRVKLVKARFSWKDFGSWNTIYEVLSKDKNSNVGKGKISISGGSNNFIYLDNPKRRVLAIGLNDIFMIEAKDYTLLTNRASLDNLKAALKEFKRIK